MKSWLTRRSNGIWYVLTKEGSERVEFVSTKTRNKKEADKFFETYVPGQKDGEQLFLTGIEKQLTDRLTGKIRQKTLKSYITVIRDLQNIIGNKEISHLTQQDANIWDADRRNHLAPTTYNTALRSIRAILNRIGKWYPQYEDGCKAFDNIELMKLNEEEKVYLTEKQLHTLMDAEEMVFYKRLYHFAFATGMRKAEIRNCKWEHINFDTNMIAVINTEEFQTKTGRNRYIPIATSLIPVLKEMQKTRDNGYLFTRKLGTKLADGNVSYAFKRSLDKTKLDKRLTFHSLRHSFIAALMSKGVDLYSIAKLAGHTSVKMIEKTYGHIQDAHLQKVMMDMSQPQWPRRKQ